MRVFVCVRVCVCKREKRLCFFVKLVKDCVCVCERERERERQREREREREKSRDIEGKKNLKRVFHFQKWNKLTAKLSIVYFVSAFANVKNKNLPFEFASVI